MPAISMFYGIVIYMYRADNQRHHAPHIHAQYQGAETVVAIEDCRVLEGSLPPGKLRLTLAWVELHRDALLADWDLALTDKTLFRIKPLD
jgi:hypothetical protein